MVQKSCNSTGAVTYPTSRCDLFDPPSELGSLRERAPICRLTFPDGHLGWLVTGHSQARAILRDSRFGMDMQRRAVPDPLLATVRTKMEGVHSDIVSAIDSGNFLRMDPPEHTRFRRLLAGFFTARRIAELRPYIEHAVSELLEEMEKAGPPVDLVESFALPVTLMTICNFLGVPDREYDTLHGSIAAAENPNATTEEVENANINLIRFLFDVVRAKREKPGDDLLSQLSIQGSLTEKEIVGIANLLVVAGHHTTSNMIALSTFRMLHDRESWEKLTGVPGSLGKVVEELLRYLTVFQTGAFTRKAIEDVEIDKVLIKKGESVHVSLPAANRDPDRFENPDIFDTDRDATGHLAFGHGLHQCLGQHLARIELEVVFEKLVHRFPDLRLAMPANDVPLHDGSLDVYGPYKLLVTWG